MLNLNTLSVIGILHQNKRRTRILSLKYLNFEFIFKLKNPLLFKIYSLPMESVRPISLIFKTFTNTRWKSIEESQKRVMLNAFKEFQIPFLQSKAINTCH